MNANQQSQPAIVVSTWHDGERSHFLSFSEVEARRATAAWHRIFAVNPIERGAAALVVALVEDTHQLVPLETALEEAGAVILNADATIYEAPRIEAFIRNFDPAYVFGLTAATLGGLANLGHDAKKLLAGRTVWVRDCAFALLQDAPEIKLLRWTNLGPATLVGCGHSDALHLDNLEWHIDIDGDRVRLTHRFGAAEPEPVVLTGLRATLRHNGCSCGNNDTLIELPIS